MGEVGDNCLFLLPCSSQLVRLLSHPSGFCVRGWNHLHRRDQVSIELVEVITLPYFLRIIDWSQSLESQPYVILMHVQMLKIKTLDGKYWMLGVLDGEVIIYNWTVVSPLLQLL